MKTIAEIQQEIRSIKTELCSLDDRLQKINDELTSFKSVTYEDSVYQKIYDLASTMPVIHHPIVDQKQDIKGNYFAILVSIAGEADSINNDQLLFLQRMILDDKERNRLGHYSDFSNKIETRDIIYRLNSSVKEELAYQLLLDLMIVVGLSRIKTKKTSETLADIATVMDINSDAMRLIADVSVIVLEQRIREALNYEQVLLADQYFGYYLSEINGWTDMVCEAEKEKKKIFHSQLTSALVGIEQNAYERYGENWFYFDD